MLVMHSLEVKFCSGLSENLVTCIKFVIEIKFFGNKNTQVVMLWYASPQRIRETELYGQKKFQFLFVSALEFVSVQDMFSFY